MLKAQHVCPLNTFDEFQADRMARAKAQAENLMARGKSEALAWPEPRVKEDRAKDGLSHGSDQARVSFEAIQ